MADTFAEWVILELLGHRRLAGYVTEQEDSLSLHIPAYEGPAHPVELMPAARIPVGNGRFAYVDQRDARWVNEFDWHLTNGYVTRVRKGRTVYLHRWLLQAPAGLLVDHRNGDKLDNRRSNLRLATHAENIRNQRRRTGGSSSFRGVTADRRCGGGRWFARIRKDYKNIHIGTFASEVDAALAYDGMARDLFGEFARPNFDESIRVAPNSVYAITPTTQEMARQVARTARPAPVQRWELPAAEPLDDQDAIDAEGPF